MTRNQKHSILALLTLLVLTANWVIEFDQAAEDYLDQSMTSGLVVYATARGLNALISVIQSIQLSINVGAGVGVNLGEVLDPLNDLIERFSSFVLYGLAAIGLQKLLLLATTSLVMKVITTLVILLGVYAWFSERTNLKWLVRLALMVLLVRFFLIIQVGTVALLDNLYFDHRSESAQSALTITSDELSNIRSKYLENVRESGIVQGIFNTDTNLVGENDDQGITDLAASAVVELIVIMLARSILIPLLFAGTVIILLRKLTTPKN